MVRANRNGEGKSKVKKLSLSGDELKRVRPGPIQNEEFSWDEMALAHYTYQVVGKHVGGTVVDGKRVPQTLERWELGFMRDLHPKVELAIWVMASVALTEWCEQERKRNNHVKKRLFLAYAMAAISNPDAPKPEDAKGQRILRNATRLLTKARLGLPQVLVEILEQYLEQAGKSPEEGGQAITEILDQVTKQWRETNP